MVWAVFSRLDFENYIFVPKKQASKALLRQNKHIP